MLEAGIPITNSQPAPLAHPTDPTDSTGPTDSITELSAIAPFPTHTGVIPVFLSFFIMPPAVLVSQHGY